MRNYFQLHEIAEPWGAPGGLLLDSRDYGVYISGSGVFSAPARRYSTIQVPGRNGDLILPERSFENATISYPGCFIYNSVEANLAAFRDALLHSFGYVELTDSYHPGEYRHVIYAEAFEPQMQPDLSAARFDLNFSAKPQRWDGFGLTPVRPQVGVATTLTNPHPYRAHPFLVVSGAGTITWRQYGERSYDITISQAPDYGDTYIDLDTMEIYAETPSGSIETMAPYVSITFAGFSSATYDIPSVPPSGSVEVDLTGSTITALTIYPRWWTL